MSRKPPRRSARRGGFGVYAADLGRRAGRQAVRKPTRRRKRVVAVVIVALLYLTYRLGAWVVPVVLVPPALGIGLQYLWTKRTAQAMGMGLRELLTATARQHLVRWTWGRVCETAGLVNYRAGRYPRFLPGMVRRQVDGSVKALTSAGWYSVSPRDLGEKAERIADAIGCHEVVVRPRRLWVFPYQEVHFYWTDVFSRIVRLEDVRWRDAPPDAVVFGVHEDGSPATGVATESRLVGGMTRKGKSNLVWAKLLSLIIQGIPVRIYVSDPKEGMELSRLGAQLGKGSEMFAVVHYADDPDKTVAMVKQFHADRRAQARKMAELGMRKGGRPTVEFPLLVLLMDETLVVPEVLAGGTKSFVGQTVLAGAASGAVGWFCTQMAQKSTALGDVRDLIPQRVALATRSAINTNMILGDDAAQLGAGCHLIRLPGVGFTFTDADHRPRKFRAPLVTDEEADLICQGIVPPKVQAALDAQNEAKLAELEGRKEPTTVYRKHQRVPEVTLDGTPTGRLVAVLAYVGITNSVRDRFAQHAATKWWWELCDPELDDLDDVHQTRRRAKTAESKAIRADQPLYNIEEAVVPAVREGQVVTVRTDGTVLVDGRPRLGLVGDADDDEASAA